MSLWKPFVRAGAAVLMLSLLGAGTGCKKKDAFKVPNIKVITKQDEEKLIDNIHFVQALDDSNIWIADSTGKIYHSGDGGIEWEHQVSPAEHDPDNGQILLTDGQFLDANTGWIPGLYGTIIHTTDGGKTWQRQETGIKRHLFCLSFVDKQNGWAVGEWNTILRTTDGGKTWQRMTEEEDKVLSNISMADTMNGWVVGEAGTILRTTDGGQTWERQMPKAFERESFEMEFENPRPSLFCIQAIDVNTAFTCGLDSNILRTTDGGKTWDVMKTEGRSALYSLTVKFGKGWAVGDKGAYLMSEDNGATWHMLDTAIKTRQWFRDVSFSSANKGWVVGQAGIVTGTNDGGKTWEFHNGLSYDMEFFEMPKALEFRGMPGWGPFARE